MGQFPRMREPPLTFSITKWRAWPSLPCMRDLWRFTFFIIKCQHEPACCGCMNQSAEAVIPFSVGKCRSGWFSFQDISRNHYIVMPPRVPVQTRLHVVRIRLNGASQSQIARTIEITQATGNSIVNAFQDEGHIGYLERNCTRKQLTRKTTLWLRLPVKTLL